MLFFIGGRGQPGLDDSAARNADLKRLLVAALIISIIAIILKSPAVFLFGWFALVLWMVVS
jgi:hypothetical protein